MDGTSRALAAAFLVALLLRLGWVYAVDSVPVEDDDTSFYHTTAINIADGHGFARNQDDGQRAVTAWHPPGYSYFLGGLYTLTGDSVRAGQIANSVLGALTVLPVFIIGRYFYSAKIGVASAWVVALLPPLVFFTSSLMTESLFAFLMAAGVALIVSARSPTGVRLPILALSGVFIGVTMLVRAQALVLLPLALVWLALPSVRSLSWRSVAVITLPIVLVVGAWTLRNVQEMDSFVLITTDAGYNFRAGHAPYSTGGWLAPEDLRRDAPSDNLTERELYYQREGLKRGLEYLTAHPVREVELSVRKVAHLWRPATDALGRAESRGATPINETAFMALDGLQMMTHLLFGAAVIAGLLLWRGSKDVVILTVVLVGLWTAGHIVIFAQPRFNVPVLPVLTPVAVAGAVLLAERARHLIAGRDLQTAA
jgi:4-amino-4-deoxy-L-arabinose transferase-like glycosyltransferase